MQPKKQTKLQQDKALARRILPLLKRAAVAQTRAWEFTDQIAEIIGKQPGEYLFTVEDSVSDLLSECYRINTPVTIDRALAIVQAKPPGEVPHA